MQASHLSNVHEYFNTTNSHIDPSSLSLREESFKSTLVRPKGPSIHSNKDPYSSVRDNIRNSYMKKGSDDEDLDESKDLFPIKEESPQDDSASRSMSDVEVNKESLDKI